MRAIVTGLVACWVAAPRAEASPRSEWVVIRVERVEVAVARADGSPWDDDTPTGETCGVLSSGEGLLRSKVWGSIAKALCPSRGGTDPRAPDLVLRFSANAEFDYLSPIAPDTLAHQFAYDLLVPVGGLPPQGLSVVVTDRDGGNADEVLGTIRVTRRDIGDLLKSRSRVKTYSDDSVTRIEVSARRYRPSTSRVVKLGNDHSVDRAPTPVLAGEVLELRTSRVQAGGLAVVGANLHQVPLDGCRRSVVQTSGGVAVGFEDATQSIADMTVSIAVRSPSLVLWEHGAAGLACGRKVSLVTIRYLQTLGGSSLVPATVKSLLRSRYLQGLMRCHERTFAGKRRPSGTVFGRFTVGPLGSVTKASIKGFDDVLNFCVQSLVAKWRFPAPKDPDGKPTSEDVELRLRLDAK